jgi:hypothetical protein
MIEQARLARDESPARADTSMREKLHLTRFLLSLKEGEIERPLRDIAAPNATENG